MNRIKMFEDFKSNNVEGSLITVTDIIKCIRKNGVIYSNIIKRYPKNDPKEPIKPVSVDNDGLITVEIDNNEYSVDIKDVIKIDY